MPRRAPPYPPAHGLLAGKTVLVTAAAGTGIGFAVARRCVEEGAQVVISDIHERRLAEAADELARGHGDRVAVACRATSPTRTTSRRWSPAACGGSGGSTCW